MPSRLSSLLVRDGLVGIKPMERAFQRQVIYGGRLDTILLEMKLVPEGRLSQYLSLATGLPPATRDETNLFDASAVTHCPIEVSRDYAVVPLSMADGALRVLVHDPVELSRLESLASEIGVSIQPLVVPEYRYHVVFGRTYDRETDARFTALAKQADDSAASVPVGKSASIIIDATLEDDAESDSMAEHVVVDVALPPSNTSVEIHRPVVTDAEPAPPRVVEAPAPAEPAPPREAPASTPVDAVPRASVDAAETPLPQPVAPPVRQRDPLAFDPTPLSIANARVTLQAAYDRDLIFATLLRAIRDHTDYAGLMTVQGGAVIGRLAIYGEIIDREEIRQVLIPLDVPSSFKQVVESASPYIGPIATGDSEIDAMIARLGGVLPQAALLLPIALRGRVVAIAVGHRGVEPISIAELSELLPLAGDAADAIMRLLMKSKAVGYRRAPLDSDAVPEVPLDEMPTKQTVKAEDRATGVDDSAAEDEGASAEPDGAWAAPTGDVPDEAVEFGIEVTLEAGEPETIETLLDLLESADEVTREQAMYDCLQRGQETLDALDDRFPGKLLVDRYEMGGRILKPAQHGPLLDLVVRLGAATGGLLARYMRHDDRDVRYYATLCTIELRPRSALSVLVERLFDSDYGVRSAAIDALAGYPTAELNTGLEPARHAIHSEDPGRVQAAASAAAELVDVKSVPDLIDAVGRGGKFVEHARRALVSLTRQDFAGSTRKWRGWWNKNKKNHRVEWLIEGLSHKDGAVRRAAAGDLRKMTGEYQGFHHDLSKKERDAAKQKWAMWWSESGRRRFLRERNDERHRPTAILPARRRDEP